MLAIHLSNMLNTHWTVVLLNGLWWKYVTEILNTAINKHASMSLNWTSFIFEMQNVFCSPAPWTHAVLKDQASLRTPNMGVSLRHAVCGGHALIKPAGSYKDQHKTLHIVVTRVFLVLDWFVLWKRCPYLWVLIFSPHTKGLHEWAHHTHCTIKNYYRSRAATTALITKSAGKKINVSVQCDLYII